MSKSGFNLAHPRRPGIQFPSANPLAPLLAEAVTYYIVHEGGDPLRHFMCTEKPTAMPSDKMWEIKIRELTP